MGYIRPWLKTKQTKASLIIGTHRSSEDHCITKSTLVKKGTCILLTNNPLITVTGNQEISFTFYLTHCVWWFFYSPWHISIPTLVQDQGWLWPPYIHMCSCVHITHAQMNLHFMHINIYMCFACICTCTHTHTHTHTRIHTATAILQCS